MAEHGKEPEAEVQATLDQANPAAITLALGKTRPGAKLPPEAAAFLQRQSRLVDLQTAHLQEQRQLLLSRLRWGRFSDRAKAALQVMTAAVGLAVVIGVTAMAWEAHEDHGLVIEAFSVPPDLAKDGLTGQVVAARFLDRLQAMQRATSSERPAASYENNWGSEIKVEIPQTGLSFSEVERLLKAKLGHASHLTGEVFRTPAGIAITARVGDVPPQTFTGPQSDFDPLTQKAAEAVYRASQPYRFAQFLQQHDRGPEAFSVISDLAANGPASERGWAFVQWGYFDLILTGDVNSARKHLLKSLAFPGIGLLGYAYLESVEIPAGHDEKVLEYFRKEENELKVNGPGYTKDILLNQKFSVAGFIAHLRGDYAEAARQLLEGVKTHDIVGSSRAFPGMAATDYALGHDLAAARSAIEPLEPNDDVSFLPAVASYGAYALPAYAIAAAKEDWPTALADARACDAWLETQKQTQKIMGLVQQTWIRPLEALALTKTGDVAGGEALIATTPVDCYLCVRVRGKIAAVKQEWPAAERWFAEAVRQSPSIPFAYSEWGEMRLAKGDLAGAIVKFDLAHQKGPRFADPLELWGEALMRRGDSDGAVDKFRQANLDAPRWGRLHVMWGEALARLGWVDQARAQLRAAGGQDLSAVDRAELARNALRARTPL